MPATQSAKSHTSLDVITHFVLLPLFLVNAVTAIWFTASHWPDQAGLHLLWIAMSFGLLLVNMKMRVYSLRNQDRLIRLEERLRLTVLLPAAEHASIQALTTSQLIALRFASDAELPALARRTLAEGLSGQEIKAAILTWRPDTQRI